MTQPVSEQPPVDDTEAQQSLRDRLSDRKVIAVIGGLVILVAVLGLFVVKPMLTGSASNDSSSFVVQHHSATPRPSTSVSPSAPVVAATPAPQPQVRDPFSPLIVPVTAAATVSPAAVAQPTTPTIVVVQPSTSTSSVSHSLTLNGVTAETASKPATAAVTLDGKAMTVTLGQAFPSAANGPYQLTFVNATSDAKHNSAEFAYGDENFALAIGQTQTEN